MKYRKILNYVWCHHHGEVHERTENPYSTKEPECNKKDWENIYLKK